ncbi:MAG TPA: hypothetical protein VKU85_10235 [bacterium]|nr:hypothetical protein [bacterium]
MRERIVPVLVLSGLLVGGLGNLLPASPDPDDPLRTAHDRFYLVKTHGAVRCDIIVVGDSRALRGISPAVLEEELPGHDVFNFAFEAGSLNEEMYRQAEARLAPGDGPRAVLLAVTPLSLFAWKAANQQYHEFRSAPPDEAWLTLHHPEVVQYFQPLRLRSFLAARFRGEKPPATVQVYHDDGWIESERIPPSPEEALGLYAVRFRDQTIDPGLVEDLLRWTREWTDRGIGVFAFRPPTTDAVVELENRMTGFDEDRFAARIEEAGGTWLRFTNDGYLAYDGSHLDRASARRFSRELGPRIRPQL